MARIDWGANPEAERATVRTVLQGVVDDLYDNGTPGFIPRVEAFMSEHKGAQAEQQRQHASNSRKLNFLLVLATIATLIVTTIGIIVGSEVSKHGSLYFHSFKKPVVADYHAQE